MSRSLRWSNLTLGLVGLGAVIAFAMAVLLFARVGGVRGPKVLIYVTAASARGLLKGSDVMVAGKRAGTVSGIRFQSPATDTLSRLLIEIELLRRALPMLRRDSYAHIRPSGTIIGAPVVDISAGTTTAAALSAGDTIPALPQVAAERVMDRVEDLTTEIGGTVQDWRSIMADVRSASGTFGAVRVRGPRDLAVFRAQTSSLMNRLTRGGGTIGLMMGDTELRTRTSRVVATVDSIATLLDSDRGTLGRFRRDGTLLDAMEATRAELADVSRAMAEARGTAGRARQDSAIRDEVGRLRAQLDLLIQDFKTNPLRYISF